MDKREELRRKLERIEREETAKQGRPPERGEDSAPSTAAASTSPPPAPSPTPEQIQELTRAEIEKALLRERAARQEESAGERAWMEAKLDELSRGLTETDERVTSLREDTRNSLLPMAEEIAELKSRQNGRELPPAPEPRNVTPRPTPKPPTWPTPSAYPPRLRQSEPEAAGGTPERMSYQPPRTRVESSPPTAGQSYEPEEQNPLLTVLWLAAGAILLILAVWGVWTALAWLLLHLWIAAALVLFLIWVAAVCLAWMIELKWHSVCIAVFGVAIITLGVASYMTYQSLTEPKPDVQMLGR